MRKFILFALTAMSLLAASSASYAWGHRGFYGPTIGIGIGVDPFYYGPGPYYYGPPPVYYAPQPIVVAPPDTYVERDASAQAPDYRYYCANPAGYYPQIPRCPKGWLKVVPDDSQPR